MAERGVLDRLLGEAAQAPTDRHLAQIHAELLRHCLSDAGSAALDALPRVVAWVASPSPRQREFVCDFFVELALAKPFFAAPDPCLVAVQALLGLLGDSAASVVKHALSASVSLLPVVLRVLASGADAKRIALLRGLKVLRDTALNLSIKSTNDGVRALSLRFAEEVISTHSQAPEDVLARKRAAARGAGPEAYLAALRVTCVNEVPETGSVLLPVEMVAARQEAFAHFKRVLLSGNLSATNLGVAANSLVALARRRPVLVRDVGALFCELVTEGLAHLATLPLGRLQNFLRLAREEYLRVPEAAEFEGALRNAFLELSTLVKNADRARRVGGEVAPARRLRSEAERWFHFRVAGLGANYDLRNPAVRRVLEGIVNIPPSTLAELILKCMEHFPSPTHISPEEPNAPAFVQLLNSLTRGGADLRYVSAAKPLTSVPPIPVPRMTPVQCRDMMALCIDRIVSEETEASVSRSGEAELRATLLSKLTHRPDMRVPASRALLSALETDLAARYDLATRWLVSLYTAPSVTAATAAAAATPGSISAKVGAVDSGSASAAPSPAPSPPSLEEPSDASGASSPASAMEDDAESGDAGSIAVTYTEAVEALLRAMQAQNREEDLLARFLLDLPELTDAACNHVLLCCRNLQRMAVGVGALRELVLHRPPTRPRALRMMLDLTVERHVKELRAAAVAAVAGELFPRPALAEAVESFACEQLEAIAAVDSVWRARFAQPPAAAAAAASSSSSAPTAKDEAARKASGGPLTGKRPREELDKEASGGQGRRLEESAMKDAGDDDEAEHAQEEEEEGPRLSLTTVSAGPAGAGAAAATAPTAASTASGAGAGSSGAKSGVRRDELAEEERKQWVARQTELFTALCLRKHALIVRLAEVFAKCTSSDPVDAHVLSLSRQRLLQQVPDLVRALGATSEPFLQLVRTCAPGTEAFVLRALYALTEHAAPSPQLVDATLQLLQRRPDARFLVPVLQSVKKEVALANLGRIVALSAEQVKAAFHRLLHRQPPVLSPDELLLALHSLRPGAPVVQASNILFQDKLVTDRVVASVINRLVDQTPLPPLTLRTMIQTVMAIPRLLPFVMSLVPQLVVKHIWTDARLWEGFARLCEKTAPHCFAPLLQFPSKWIADVLERAPALRGPFSLHVRALVYRGAISRAKLQELSATVRWA